MRKPRVIQEGATYHVVAKANRGEFIFETDEMKLLFLSFLERAKKKYNFRLNNYCIMSNHIHLLIKPATGTSLSEIMQWLLSNFAKRFNKIRGQFGHVWYDRYKSTIIITFQHFIHAFQYISNNPVNAGICSKARNYHYGGLYEFIKMRFKLVDYQKD